MLSAAVNFLLTKHGAATLLGAATGLIGGVTVWNLFGSRVTPEEHERKRRAAVNVKGRIGAATIVDARDTTLYYHYTLAGVHYAASQDIAEFREQLPEDLATLIGPAGFKYLPRNPANSILICEDWSGIRVRHHRAAS